MPAPSSPDPNAATPHGCGVCGTPLAAGRLGAQCPRCLLSLGSSFGLPGEDGAGDGMLDALQVRSFGDYELLEEIARGGMGIVYRARQVSLGREVAVKMILAGELATRDSVERFRNEAAAAAKLDHPHIVSVYEIGEHETQHFFSMRLVTSGRNIATWAKSLEGARERRAKAIAASMAKVARAVAFAHERGVLHRDLKPSNILVNEAGEPHVTDFGLAKMLHEADCTLTLSSAMVGSPSYMAPEQADGRGRDVTTLTDVYGLGAVLYELLAGRPPFLGNSPLSTARRVIEELPPRLENPPRDLETICLKCLEKNPAQRYASALSVAEDLERFTRGEPVRARPLTTREALWRWCRRKPAIASLSGATALALVAGLLGVTWQWRQAEQARVAQQKALDHLQWKEISRQVEGDEAPLALAHLASVLRENPQSWQAAMFAMSIVERRSFPVLAGPPVQAPAELTAPALIFPDGRRIVAAGRDGAARIWEVATGEEAAMLALNSEARALAIAPDGMSIIIGAEDGAVREWRLPEAESRPLPRSMRQPVNAFGFSADGTMLAALSAGGIELWRMDERDAEPRVVPSPGIDRGLAVNADGRRVFAFGKKEAVVWDADTGQRIHELPAREQFRAGAMDLTGGRLAMVDGPFRAAVWDVATGERLQLFESDLSSILFLAFNASGNRLTIAFHGNDLGVFDVSKGSRISPPMQHLYEPRKLAVSADGSRTASCGADGRIRLWNATDGRAVMEPILCPNWSEILFELARDGSSGLLTLPVKSGGGPQLQVWRSTRSREPRRHAVAGSRDFDPSRISPDGRLGCLGLWPEPRAYLYEIETDRVVLDRRVAGGVYVHLFSPDMRRYYALTANGWLYGWSLETGEALWAPNQQPGLIRPAEISSDGSRIIAGHNDGHIRIYDTATGLVVQTLDHPGEVKVLRFAPDRSGRFVSGSTDGLAHVWSLGSGQKLATLRGHSSTILTAAFSPDGRQIATGSYDHTVRLWNAATGELLPTRPIKHLGDLSHLEYHPGGRLLATASRDGTARLWDPATGEPRSNPLSHGTDVETVRFTRDGRCLLTKDHEGFRFWDVAKAEPVTVHHPFPVSGGIGMDAVSYRALLSPDDRRVFLGSSANMGAAWEISIPPGDAPAWFPGLLEALALTRLDPAGQAQRVPGTAMLDVGRQLATLPEDFYARWVKEVLGRE